MEDTCETGLALTLGYGRKSPTAAAAANSSESLEPSLLTLGRQSSSSSHSTLSSLSNLKMEREGDEHDGGGGREAIDRISSQPVRPDRDDRGGGGKKLRLSKEQSALLEGMFKEQSTLNPKQKVALAKQLNLRPRQVEVWFQNRRARTKLKQTEVDYELMRKYCDMLIKENQRLKMELQELKAVHLAPALIYAQQLPAATVTICASCQKTRDDHGGPKAAPS